MAAATDHADAAGLTGPTSRLMNELGLYLKIRCQFPDAERLYHRALAIDEASYGPDHPRVATELNNLASLLWATNRLGEAQPLMHRTGDRRGVVRPGPPQRRHPPQQPGALLQATNRLGEAEPLMHRAQAIDETSYGPDHPDVAIRLNNLAMLLKDTNRPAEAEPLDAPAHWRSTRRRTARTTPTSPSDLNNLAQLLQATNRLGEAEPLMRRALAIDEASYGPDHPNVATRPQQPGATVAGHEPAG